MQIIIIIIINEGDTFCSDSTLYYTDALKRHGKILFFVFFFRKSKRKKKHFLQNIYKPGDAQHVQSFFFLDKQK